MKACPELDFKYFSNFFAFFILLKAKYVSTAHGAYNLLYPLFLGSLCCFNLFAKSSEYPLYIAPGCNLLFRIYT